MKLMKTIVCLICGKEKEVQATKQDAKYCSKACFVQSKIGQKRAERKIISCLNCGKTFEIYKSQTKKKYCSPKCKHDYMRGKSRPEEYKLKMALQFGSTVRQHNQYKSGYITLTRLDKTFWFRSSYEEKALKIFDGLSIIKDVVSEKTCIPYVAPDKTIHYYVIDYTVTLFNLQKILVEIKPKRFVTFDTNICKFKAAQEYAENHNMKFVVLTQEHLNNTSVETMLLGVNQVATTIPNTTGEDIVRPVSIEKIQKQEEITCSQ